MSKVICKADPRRLTEDDAMLMVAFVNALEKNQVELDWIEKRALWQNIWDLYTPANLKDK